jgi:hypothetical protein
LNSGASRSAAAPALDWRSPTRPRRRRRGDHHGSPQRLHPGARRRVRGLAAVGIAARQAQCQLRDAGGVPAALEATSSKGRRSACATSTDS